jgi:hypothetical protein
MPYDPRERAFNDHSCVLACIVSCLRQYEIGITQEAIIASLRRRYPEWDRVPGAVDKDQAVNLLITFFQAESVVLTLSKRVILEQWRASTYNFGMIMTKRQRRDGGQWEERLHAWRILSCDERELLLMNPRRDEASVGQVEWDFIREWQGTVMIAHSRGRPVANPLEWDPYV